MPGMGLTAIGLAGVTLSYAGIAHTFIDGLHALSGLVMFVLILFDWTSTSSVNCRLSSTYLN